MTLERLFRSIVRKSLTTYTTYKFTKDITRNNLKSSCFCSYDSILLFVLNELKREVLNFNATVVKNFFSTKANRPLEVGKACWVPHFDPEALLSDSAEATLEKPEDNQMTDLSKKRNNLFEARKLKEHDSHLMRGTNRTHTKFSCSS